MTFLIHKKAAILTASCSSDCALSVLSSSSSVLRVARLQMSRIEVMSCLTSFRNPVIYGISFSVWDRTRSVVGGDDKLGSRTRVEWNSDLRSGTIWADFLFCEGTWSLPFFSVTGTWCWRTVGVWLYASNSNRSKAWGQLFDRERVNLHPIMKPPVKATCPNPTSAAININGYVTTNLKNRPTIVLDRYTLASAGY